MDTKQPINSAALVIDMQNGFCHPEGSSAALGLWAPTAPAAVAATADMLEAARTAGWPVVYVRHVFRPALIDAPPRLLRMWQGGPAPVVRGTWDAEIVDEIKPLPHDHLIDKNRFDAFLYTDLEVLLRALGVERLLIAGLLTNICVETTVRSADQRGFDCYVAEDCTASHEGAHTAALTAMSGLFATVGPWRELVTTLTGTTPAE